MLRLATRNDISHIKRIARIYDDSDELGFVSEVEIRSSVEREECLYDLSGSFCLFHRRRDKVTKVYAICVPENARGRGLGKSMLAMLCLPIELTCAEDNPNNGFYKHLGFTLVAVKPGRKRNLNIWRLDSR